MKTHSDPRHKNRIHLMQQLFAWQASPKNEHQDISEIILNLKKIDKKITEAALAWPIKQINKIDLAILRLAVYELIMTPKIPEKVVADEAVELAKEYGSDSSPSFINGVLGKVIGEVKNA